MKLFKKDSDGDIRFLEIKTDGADLIQISGLVGTDKPIEHRKTCKAKNIGKSNETTPEVQALAQKKSLILTKLREGYFEKMADAVNKIVILPMLAKDYKKEKHKIQWPAWAQPKLDGMRGLGDKDLISRENVVLENLPHITDEIRKIEGILDGEVYAHGLSFQENMKLIKKWREGESDKIQYHVYDLVMDAPFKVRYEKLKNLIKGAKHIHLVPTIQVNNEAELKKAHEKFLEEGYEGTILRHGNDSYKINARSSSLLKYKDFQDTALTIVDVIPCKQRTEWGEPVFYWKGAKGHRYGDDHIGAGMRYTHAERIDFLKNKNRYIGKIAEVRFFEFSDTGVPRFPVMHGIRIDKSKADKAKK